MDGEFVIAPGARPSQPWEGEDVPCCDDSRTSPPQMKSPRKLGRQRKLKICENCPTAMWSEVPSLGKVRTCGKILTKKEAEHCGCIIKLKVLVPGQKCPQGKW